MYKYLSIEGLKTFWLLIEENLRGLNTLISTKLTDVTGDCVNELGYDNKRWKAAYVLKIITDTIAISGGTTVFGQGTGGYYVMNVDKDATYRGKNMYLYSTGGVYLGAGGSVAVTSDETLKTMLELDVRFLNFARSIIPMGYVYTDHIRTHIGFGAQSIERALLENGLTTKDFAGLVIEYDVKEYDDEGNITLEMDKRYSLRYEEFIGLVRVVQIADAERIGVLEAQMKGVMSSLKGGTNE